MKLTGLNNKNTQEKILKKVREKEYIKRCIVVNICPWCGKSLRNIESHPHYSTLACPDKDCRGAEKIRKNNQS